MSDNMSDKISILQVDAEKHLAVKEPGIFFRRWSEPKIKLR